MIRVRAVQRLLSGGWVISAPFPPTETRQIASTAFLELPTRFLFGGSAELAAAVATPALRWLRRDVYRSESGPLVPSMEMMMSIEAGSEPIGNPSSARNCPSLLNGGIVVSSRVHHTFSDSVVPPPSSNTRDPGLKRIYIA